MAATSVKAIRCSDDDIERNRLLRLHRGEEESESELMLVAMRLGLRVLAAQARTKKVGQYAGYDPVELAQRLRMDLLPALDFLTDMDELPRIFFHAVPPVGDVYRQGFRPVGIHCPFAMRRGAGTGEPTQSSRMSATRSSRR